MYVNSLPYDNYQKLQYLTVYLHVKCWKQSYNMLILKLPEDVVYKVLNK